MNIVVASETAASTTRIYFCAGSVAVRPCLVRACLVVPSDRTNVPAWPTYTIWVIGHSMRIDGDHTFSLANIDIWLVNKRITPPMKPHDNFMLFTAVIVCRKVDDIFPVKCLSCCWVLNVNLSEMVCTWGVRNIFSTAGRSKWIYQRIEEREGWK